MPARDWLEIQDLLSLEVAAMWGIFSVLPSSTWMRLSHHSACPEFCEVFPVHDLGQVGDPTGLWGVLSRSHYSPVKLELEGGLEEALLDLARGMAREVKRGGEQRSREDALALGQGSSGRGQGEVAGDGQTAAVRSLDAETALGQVAPGGCLLYTSDAADE